MTDLLLALFALLVADQHTPCDTRPVQTRDGVAHTAVICIVDKLPEPPASVPAELKPLLGSSLGSSGGAAPNGGGTAPQPQSVPGGHVPRWLQPDEHGWLHVKAAARAIAAELVWKIPRATSAPVWVE